MKYVKQYSAVFESTDRGAVIFVKGRPREGGRRLYVTKILGKSQFKPGAITYFLPQEIFRVKEIDGALKAVKVQASDPDLKEMLNFKSPGKISLVQNNSKTPWHWRSLKHDKIYTAIADLEDEIRSGDYLLT